MVVKINWMTGEKSVTGTTLSGSSYGDLMAYNGANIDEFYLDEVVSDSRGNQDPEASDVITNIMDIIVNYMENPKTWSRELFRYLRSEPYFKSKTGSYGQLSLKYETVLQALKNLSEEGLKIYTYTNPTDRGWIIKY